MSDFTEFKRLHFFTGFFTTAEDWNQGQDYHQEKRKLHNRGLHTPGIIRGIGDDLGVRAGTGLNLLVLPGAAIDGEGNEICLGAPRTLEIDPEDYTDFPQLVYIAIRYGESESDYVENVESPEYSGYTRTTEIPRLEVTTSRPDNRNSLELARINLTETVTQISEPQDPGKPETNEIDRRFVAWAGSVGVAEEPLPLSLLEGLIRLMVDKRRDFAALATRFPVPSATDVRQAALMLEILARTGSMRPEDVPEVLGTIATIEQDVAQEIGLAFPGVITAPEYVDYQSAVSQLLEALRTGEELGILLPLEAGVAEAARELSEIVLQPPEADAGPDQSATARLGEGAVTLDGGGSRGFGGRRVVRYRWDRRE
jgi:hypothetical protein